MTKNKTYLLIAIIAFLVFSSIFNINFYTQKSKSTSYWTEVSKVKMEKPSKDLFDENFVKTMPVKLLMSQNIFSDPPVTIEGITDLDINADYNIDVGFGRFIPLYRITKFNSRFDINWSGIILQNGKAIKLSKSGSLNVSGKYKIAGLCSAKMTKQQIQNAVIKRVKDKIAEDIEDEVKKKISVTASL